MLRYDSIRQLGLTAICIAATTGCPPPKNNSVRNKLQQTRYERIVLGFTTNPEAVVFVELRDGALPALHTIRLDHPESAEPVLIDAMTAESVDDSGATRAQVVETVRASSTGARLEAYGMHWARLTQPPIATELGTVDRVAEHIRAQADSATAVDIATVANLVLPAADVWSTSDDGALFAVELVYPGQPRVRDLHVFRRDNVDVRLALLRAEQALERGADDEATRRLDWAAVHTSAGDPNAAAIAYAKARVAARRHDVDGAVDRLRDAIARERRYRGLARYEHDFDAVRDDAAFIAFWAMTPDR